MGLLDNLILEAKKYIRDASPGGLLNPEVPPGGPTEVAKGLLGFTPGIGEAISAHDAYQAFKESDWPLVALGVAGAVPLVGGMARGIKAGKNVQNKFKQAGQITDLPTLKWNTARGEPSFPVGDWRGEPFIPKSEINELFKDAQSQTEYGETLRALRSNADGRIRFAWPWAAAHHSDVGHYFGLSPDDYSQITIP